MLGGQGARDGLARRVEVVHRKTVLLLRLRIPSFVTYRAQIVPGAIGGIALWAYPDIRRGWWPITVCDMAVRHFVAERVIGDCVVVVSAHFMDVDYLLLSELCREATLGRYS